MLEEVFIIIGFTGYFDFDKKKLKTNRINKMAASIQSFLHVKLPITFLFPSRFLSDLYQNSWFLKLFNLKYISNMGAKTL